MDEVCFDLQQDCQFPGGCPLWVSLPTTQRPDVADARFLVAEATSVAKRILIADDHESVLRHLRSLLTKAGWEICGDAVDGNEAVAKAIELRPDVIILDLVMPRMNGLKAAQAIRTVLPTLPIVINTLYRTAQVEVEANKHGIRRVVDKGNPGALISAVEELLDAA